MRILYTLLLGCLLSLPASAATMANAFDDHDGDFSAKIALSDPKDLEEYKKPSNEGVRINLVDKVKVGQPFATHVIFMGMALDEKQNCDVSFDIKMLDPDGKVYGRIDQKDIPALQGGPITQPGLVFNSQSVLTVTFDPPDKAGTYKFMAVVHDNIGKKNVPVSTEIQLIK